jgi:hypothetical protein
MPGAAPVGAVQRDLLDAFAQDQNNAGVTAWTSTMRAAATFLRRLERSGGWQAMDPAARQLAVSRAPRFASWLMVTGRLAVDATLLAGSDLRLGVTAKRYLPAEHARFVAMAQALHTRADDITLQWNTLIKITAVTGVGPDHIGESEFESARVAIIDAYMARGLPESGRNMASIFHRLRLTLFHAGRLDRHRSPTTRTPVSVTGWTAVTPVFADTARRYIDQVTLSLRPNTVNRIEHDLREFGTWLAAQHPDVVSCADLERHHIEAYKTWLLTEPRRAAAAGRCIGSP